MKCQQISKYLYNYCDDKVSPNVKTLLEEHLKECNSCANNYKLTMIENEVLRNPVTVPSLSDDFAQRVMQSIAPNQLTMNHVPLVRKRWLPTAIVASTALVLLCIGLHFSDHWWSPDKIKVAENAQVPQAYSKQADRAETLAAGTGNTKDLTPEIAMSASVDEKKRLPSKTELMATSIDHRSELEVSRFKSTTVPTGSHPQKMIMVPMNVPPEFTLTEVRNTETDNTYTYSNLDHAILEIKLTILQKESAMMDQSNIALDCTELTSKQYAPTLKTAPMEISLMSPQENPDVFFEEKKVANERNIPTEENVTNDVNNIKHTTYMNSLTLIKVMDQAQVEVTLNSSLTEQELFLIADTIGFEEK